MAGSGGRIELVATDLDGTLLTADGHVSQRTRSALARLDARGIALALVSGRPPRFVRRLAQELGIGCYAICCNGALVYDRTHHEALHHHTLPSDVAQQLVNDLQRELPEAGFAVERGELFGWDATYAAIDSRYVDADGLLAEAAALCCEPVTKLIVRHPRLEPEDLLPLVRAVVGAAALVTHSGAAFVEISAQGVEKSLGLAALCDHIGVRAGGVLAFGDMPNDLPLLRWAGWGVAVANAHPDVLQAADEVTRSNQEDGVALVLERLLA